ncbi:MAG: dihydroorotase [Gammaproteobacteria bacterium]|nr:dihydroorotase [Gammaproteobacteria bacterium]
MSDTLTLRRPDDWHVHLRDGAALAAVLPHTARQFARAIVMPNLKPPVTTTALALAYRDRIRAARPEGSDFEPLMTLYLTDNTAATELEIASRTESIVGCKLYPSGATTNSDSGVTDVRRLDEALAAMAQFGLVLQVHGEVTADSVDVFERERRFIDEILAPLVERYPTLKVVFEHITTAAAVDFVSRARAGVGATITPQHLLYNRNEMFRGGIRPHFYCLPILKTESDREALIAAATGDNPRFFLGTDSAPHARHTKENACGCAGMYSAHAALELYAEIFDSRAALSRFEAFASERGPDFYGLPRNETRIEMRRVEWQVPAEYNFGSDVVVPIRAGEKLRWIMVRA